MKIRLALTLFCLGLAWGPLSRAARTPERCPGSFDEWSAWREWYVTTTAFFTPEGSLTESKLSLFLDACEKQPEQKQFFENGSFRACMRNLMAFGRSAHEFNGESWSEDFIPSRAEEFASHPRFKAFVAPFQDSHAIQSVLKARLGQTDAASRERNEAVFSSLLARMPAGVRAMSYKSELLNHRGGAVFALPGSGNGPDDIDQYLHFDPLHNGFLSITIRKRDEQGRPLHPPQIYFADFRINNDGKVKMRSDDGGNCLVCHRAGAMPVVPTSGRTVQSYGKGPKGSTMLSWFNQEQIPRTSGATPPGVAWQQLGSPPLGPDDDRARTDEFMRGCIARAKMPPPIRMDRVRDAMDCARCHNGAKAGIISPPFSPGDFPSLVSHLVHNGMMPPKTPLSRSERHALSNCLYEEYFGGVSGGPYAKLKRGVFLDWLLRTACPVSGDNSLATSSCRVEPPTSIGSQIRHMRKFVDEGIQEFQQP